MAFEHKTTEEDKTALRKLSDGMRTSWKTVTLYDVFDDSAIHVSRPSDLRNLEVWSVEGKTGVTTFENRRQKLLDDYTDEPITDSQAVVVYWVDSDGQEHRNMLAASNVPSLASDIRKALDDELDYNTFVPEIRKMQVVAERMRDLEIVRLVTNAYKK